MGGSIMSFRDPALRAEILRLFDLARRNSSDPAKRHHVVPQSYLVRWHWRGKLRAVDVNQRTTFPNIAKNVGFHDRFYDMGSEDLDPISVPPMLMETLFGQVEGWAVPVIDKMIDGGAGVLEMEERNSFATYMALQYTRGLRTRRFIEQTAQFYVQETMGSAGEPYVREVLGPDADQAEVEAGLRTLQELREGRIFVQPQRAQSVWMAASGAERVAEVLAGRRWMVYESDLPFITCDEPVVVIPSPAIDARQTWGVATSGLVVFPLNPRFVLALLSHDLAGRARSNEQYLSAAETTQINTWIAGNAHRWAYSRGDSTDMSVPLVPPEVLWFDVEREPRLNGEQVRVFTPSRWLYATPPGRPTRWWS